MPVPRPSYPMIAARQIEMLARESGIPTELVPSVSKLFRRVLDKQAMDERLNYQWIADNRGGARFSTIVVAAADSSPGGKAGADFVCSGTDDQVTFQAALDALGGWGGEIVALEGAYYVANLSLYRDNVTLRGMGPSSVIHRQAGSSVALLTGGSYNIIRDLWVEDAAASSAALVSASGYYSSIINVTASNNGDGPGIELAAPYTAALGCHVYVCDSGIEIDGVRAVVLDCIIEDPITFGVSVVGASDGAVINGNLITGATGGAGTGIDISSTAKHAAVVSNTVKLMPKDGIVVAGEACLVSANGIYEVGRLTNNTYDGIRVDGVGNSVTDNRVSYGAAANKAKYGINVAAGANRTAVRDNHLYQSGVTASFNDAGANTNVVDAAGNYV